MNYTLAEYVQHLYATEAPISHARDALWVVQDQYWFLQHQLTLPWRRVTSWQWGEPPSLRSALPVSLFRSIIRIALLWKWYHFVDVALLMYTGLGRPGKVFAGSWERT